MTDENKSYQKDAPGQPLALERRAQAEDGRRYSPSIGRNKDVVRKYESACKMAKTGGFIHDAAISDERWGEYLLTILADSEGAKARLTESMMYWKEWGALAKVQRMEKKYTDLWP